MEGVSLRNTVTGWVVSTYLVGVRTKAEVLYGLTRVLRATEEENVRASGCAHGELVEGDALAAGLLDASAGSRSEAKRADGHLGNLIEAVVVCDRADHSADLALVQLGSRLACSHAHDLAQAQRRLVDPAAAQTLEDGLVELAVGAAGEEAVQLVEEREVGVLAFRSLTVARLHVVGIEIDL